MNALIKTFGAEITMSSREIAGLTGKDHKNVLADIRKMLNSTVFSGLCAEATYQDSMNRPRKEFVLHEALVCLILQKYKGFARVPHQLQEEAALKTIEQLLGIKLIRQFRVLSYRIDGYCIESNTAYEIDEPEHKSKAEKDAFRQREIESAIGCKFVRISL